MNKLTGWKNSYAILVLCAAVTIPVEAQNVKTLLTFNGTDGAYPEGYLIQGTDGELYGTTFEGGDSFSGVVFKIATGGKETVLHNFEGYDGDYPSAGLVQAKNGVFYGTTSEGGNGYCSGNGCGTVFEITAGGKFTTLYSFCTGDCSDGELPASGLIQATNGKFYGTAWMGGNHGAGTVFEITAGGKFTTLYSFCAKKNCIDGENPSGELTQATNGEFYGTTQYGGTHNDGTVFKITADGKLTTLHSFAGSDGERPMSRVIQATDGAFYGMTDAGANRGGTVFKITTTGKLTTLYRFCTQKNCTDGADPTSGFVQGKDGDLYGTTSVGGTMMAGTVFKITTAGKLTTLYSFCAQENCSDGEFPESGLVQANNGKFYGTTNGFTLDGTIFSLSGGRLTGTGKTASKPD
jgi:uncharacterized repeat protein (TIGR03803 family)